MDQPIYHLAVASEWEEALRAGGPYTRSTAGLSFEEEGFIHCSFADQLYWVVHTFYGGRRDVVLLIIDPTGLDVRVEEGFPHIYEPLPLTAVISTTESIDTEINKGLMRRYLDEVWTNGRPEAIEVLAADTYRRYTTATGDPLDRGAQIARLSGIRQSFPDADIEVKALIADGDMVALRGIMTGTHEGEFMGISPTGRRFTVGLHDFMRFEDGLITEQWGGPDLLDLVRQLGGRIEGP